MIAVGIGFVGVVIGAFLTPIAQSILNYARRPILSVSGEFTERGSSGEFGHSGAVSWGKVKASADQITIGGDATITLLERVGARS